MATYPLDVAGVMTFNEELQMYVLDKDYIKTKLNIDLEAESKKVTNAVVTNMPELWSEDVSQEMYEFIYAHGDHDKLQSIMKYVPSARAIIQRALGHWATFKARSGNLSELSGVLYEKGIIMDRQALNQASIPPRAERVLTQDLPELGYSLLYAGLHGRYNEEDYS